MIATAAITSSRKTVSTRPRGYIEHYSPQQATMALINDAIGVIEEYREHWPLTARQIYYRLIGNRGYAKTEQFYERLCHHLGNARRARRIPFDAMRDDGVSVMSPGHYAGESGFYAHVQRLAKSYERDKLADQRVYLEVWCEAAGMQPQLAEVAHIYSVPVYSCSGFDSLTAKKWIAERVCTQGKNAIILHLGDYDPSGVAIFDAVAEDVAAFVAADRPHGYCSVAFERVALTADQVRAYELPTAPAKATDSRSKRWSGETCQLEALAPDQIAAFLDQAIRSHLDKDQLRRDRDREKQERQQLTLALPAASGRMV